MSQIVAAARAVVFVVGCALVSGAWHTAAQTPTVSLKDFQSSMIEIGEAFEVIEEMMPSPAYLLNSARGDAIARVDVARTRMEAVRKFFADRNKANGVELSDGTIAAMDVLRRELTRATPDQAAAIEALEDVSRACTACHDAYREGDKDRGYRFKVGAL
jgi:hypothetical protein